LDKKFDKQNLYANTIIDNLKSKYTDSKTHRDDYYKFIENFIETIQTTIGDTIKFGNSIIHLRENYYIINHTHLGHPLEPHLIIPENSKMISFKKDNQFFKTNVISYITSGTTKIEVFYDMYTHILLGYKEFNKDYVKNTKSQHKIIVEESLLNKIKYLGNSNTNVKIGENDINDLVENICRERIENVRNIIYKFIVYINTIKNILPKHSNQMEDSNINLIDIDNYHKKLSGLITKTPEHKVFKQWNLIIQNIHYKRVSTKKVNLYNKSNYINLDDVYEFDYSGNLLLFYFINEMSKLIDINKNKFVRQNLIQFITEFIDMSYNYYSNSRYEYNNELQRFECMLNSSDYYRELEEKGFGMDEFTTGIYGEYTDPDTVKSKEELKEEEELKAELDSIDIDNDIDAEDNYDNAYTDRMIMRNPPLKWDWNSRNKSI